MPATVRVVPVRDRRDFQHFLKLPWQIYRNDPLLGPFHSSSIRNSSLIVANTRFTNTQRSSILSPGVVRKQLVALLLSSITNMSSFMKRRRIFRLL